MALLRLNEIDPQHRRTVRGKDIRRFQIFSNQNQPIGKVTDALLDNTNQFHYLIADIDSPKPSEHVLIPIRQAQVDLEGERIYLSNLDATQITELPTYSATDQHTVERANTGRIAESHPSIAPALLVLEDSAPLEASLALESVTPLEAQVVKLVHPVTTAVTSQTRVENSPVASTSDNYPVAATQTTDLEQMSVPKQAVSAQTPSQVTSEVLDEQSVRLLEERLFVNRQKRKVGEVIVRKEIETQIVEIPIRRERLIVEQVSPEHKQLASIDLSQGDLDGIELLNAQHSAIQGSMQTIDMAPSSPNSEVISSEFSSPEAAIEFLRAIAVQPNSAPQRIQIHLIK